MVQVTIEPVPIEQKEMLRRLLQLYLYDMSEFTGDGPDANGEFHYRYFDRYWAPAAGEERYPLLIRCAGKPAGFALVRRADGEWSMAEFFIVRGHRREGVGSAAATMVFAQFPGRWIVHELASNRPARAFWPRVIGSFTGGQFESGADTDGVFQRFVSHRERE